MVRKIDPDYSHRYLPKDIWASYGSDAEVALAAGDFMSVAEYADDPELKGCALVLGGLLQNGVEILSDLEAPSGRAQLCLAYGHWALGHRDAALAAIHSVPPGTTQEMAERLRSLIEAKRIPVFLITAHLPVFTGQDPASYASVHNYGAFEVKYVGSQLKENAYGYDPIEPFDEFIEGLPADERPAFIFAPTPQWILPRNLGSVPIPKVMWTHDGDNFLYRAFDNFRQFDVQITMTAHDAFELSRATHTFCASNVMSNTLCEAFPQPTTNNNKRDIDVFFSGSALKTWHTEKSRFLFRLGQISDSYRICILDGHIPEAAYLSLLKQAKTLPIVGRYVGNASPRWRDALSNGVCLLYPEGTAYGNFSSACLAHDPTNIPDSIVTSLSAAAANGIPPWETPEAFATVDRQFAISTVSRSENFERLLKYVAFLALVWRAGAPKLVSIPQRRLVWLTPWIDCSIFGFENVTSRIQKIAASIQEADCMDEQDYSNAAQLSEHLARVRVDRAEVASWRDSRDEWLAKGLARFPDSLLLHFNRAYFWFFQDEIGNPASRDFFETITAGFSRLHFDALGSDIAGGMLRLNEDPVFPHYEYADLVLKQSIDVGRAAASREAAQVVLAASYAFLGFLDLRAKRMDQGFARIEQSLEMFPRNVPLLTTRFNFRVRAVRKKPFDEGAKEFAIKAFFDLADFYPTILLTEIGLIAEMLLALRQQEQLVLILDQWYRFASAVYFARTGEEIAELRQIRQIMKCRSFLPPTLQSKIEAWRAGELPEAGCSQVDLLLCAAARGKSARWVLKHHDLPLVPLGWRRSTERFRSNTFQSINQVIHSNNKAVQLFRRTTRRFFGPVVTRVLYQTVRRLAP